MIDCARSLPNSCSTPWRSAQQPELNQALVEAIDRRVDEAVKERLGRVEWPDPDAFADAVIAAARGRAGSGDGSESYRARPRGGDGPRGRAPAKRRLGSGQIAAIVLGAILLIAAATYFLLRNWNGPESNTVVMNVQTNSIEPTPDGANMLLPPGNAAAPTSAGAAQNIQGPTP
jgi:hypothetical protein